MNALPITRRGLTLGLAGLAGSWETGRAAQVATPGATPCVAGEDGACLPLAPDTDRVDLGSPTFGNPTAITNPLFPVSALAQVIQLGEDAGESLRVEVTLLPETQAIPWNGETVETLQSQFVGYAGGQVVEVAIDWFAQDDAGNVWYFGEDVANYEDGEVTDTDGSWRAGEDGPPGMIMPANPQVGDAYRPENVPGLVFEQDTVAAIDVTVDGPRGNVDGAIRVDELLMEGTTEHKVFAPGYGEFRAEAEDELATVAIAVPVDARDEPAPDALGSLLAAVRAAATAAVTADWAAATARVTEAGTAWESVREAGVPPLLEEAGTAALDALGGGIDGEDAEECAAAAWDGEVAALGCWLLYAPVTEVDLGRMAAWSGRAGQAAGDGNTAVMHGAVATIEAIWVRTGHGLERAAVEGIGAALDSLRSAADGGDAEAVAAAAATLQEMLGETSPLAA